jgi:2-polyprenyl-3-methyl-5-hydroxy-6-metoxy-1,4-benzoquinol methylase
MERCSIEKAQREASEIQKKAKAMKGEDVRLTNEDYKKAEESADAEKRGINNVPKWDKVYKEKTPDEIPWNFEEAPAWFQDIIRSGWVRPCDALDVGCGLGNYSSYLAKNGFDVTGVDFSKEAIKQDQSKYQLDNLKFQTCDALDLKLLEKEFSFVVDISLFHHIKPEERKRYAESLASVTSSGAKVLVCCFSIKDELFKGRPKFYGPDTDTVTFVLSEDDIRDAFKDHFEIEKIEELAYGKIAKFKNSTTRKRHLVFMTRK